MLSVLDTTEDFSLLEKAFSHYRNAINPLAVNHPWLAVFNASKISWEEIQRNEDFKVRIDQQLFFLETTAMNIIESFTVNGEARSWTTKLVSYLLSYVLDNMKYAQSNIGNNLDFCFLVRIFS